MIKIDINNSDSHKIYLKISFEISLVKFKINLIVFKTFFNF
jgi:hypothetical protein